jgi:hypothetical protein
MLVGIVMITRDKYGYWHNLIRVYNLCVDSGLGYGLADTLNLHTFHRMANHTFKHRLELNVVSMDHR